MKIVQEHSVPCGWCGAKEEEPCIDNHNKPYLDGSIHRPRAWRFYGIRSDTW